MIRELIATGMISLVPLFGFLAFAAVTKKKKSQEQLLAKPAVASASEGLECFYVATVLVDSPLERIWAWGLGSRGDAQVSSHGNLVSVLRKGEYSFDLPLQEVELSRATIDKGVEKQGIVCLIWTNNGIRLATQIRFRSAQSQEQFLEATRNIDRVK